MAQKAAKAIAKRNTQTLNRTHLIALAVNLFFIVSRIVIFRKSFTRSTAWLYTALSIPAVIIEVVFEINSRPSYKDATATDLRRSGEDLDAKGLTEWMWDVLYWTWICITLAAIIGDYAWWLYIAVPTYSIWLAYSTFGNMRSAMGMPSASSSGTDAQGSSASSKRQQKLEKRGGQKVQYR